MEGEDVICPDSVLKALSSHGWIIPSEQQVSKNIVTISKRAIPLTQRCSASKWALHIYWYLLSVITVDDDDDDDEEEDDGGDGDGDDFSDDCDNGLVIEIVMMELAIDGSGVGDEKWWWGCLFISDRGQWCLCWCR